MNAFQIESNFNVKESSALGCVHCCQDLETNWHVFVYCPKVVSVGSTKAFGVLSGPLLKV